MSCFNCKSVDKSLRLAFENNSEIELLKILKQNSFLFYELYSRKFGIQPNFCEISFGDTYRCDFAWLNDDSFGPEWVLVEIEKPKINLFTKKGEPTSELNHAIEQVKSWDRYFKDYPNEKRRIFGAVSRFRYIIVAGEIKDWEEKNASKWRKHHFEESKIEIRSSNVFFKPLNLLLKHESIFESFMEHPVSLKHSELRAYWEKYSYIGAWREKLDV